MSTVYLSICLCHFRFLSSMSYSFPSTDLLLPWLVLFQGILCFWFNCNGVCFPHSLLVYRNTTDSCMLIFYPATLLNLFICSNSFLVVSSGFSMYSIMSSANSDSFTFFLSNFDAFYFFFLSNSMAWTSSTMLNRSGKSGYPCLVPDFRENAFSFPPLSMILVVNTWSLLCWGMINLYQIFWEFLS